MQRVSSGSDSLIHTELLRSVRCLESLRHGSKSTGSVRIGFAVGDLYEGLVGMGVPDTTSSIFKVDRMLGLTSALTLGVIAAYCESASVEVWRKGVARHAVFMQQRTQCNSRISRAKSFRLFGKSKRHPPYKSYRDGGERSLPFPAFLFLSLRILRLGRLDYFPFSFLYSIRSEWPLLPHSPFLVFLLYLLPWSLCPGQRRADLAAPRGISPIPLVRSRV
ncbi:hypothetical protein BHM03_00052271 [Ensete ventricosum]|nr:hypothetical protein BHM03_00052271 [Ensete ventricosum]